MVLTTVIVMTSRPILNIIALMPSAVPTAPNELKGTVTFRPLFAIFRFSATQGRLMIRTSMGC